MFSGKPYFCFGSDQVAEAAAGEVQQVGLRAGGSPT